MNAADDLTVDLFAGPGGWDEGARMIGLPGRVIGVEWDPAACATALAAGHDRYQGDLSLIPVDKFGPFRGLIASPPCQAYSRAGKGLGKLDQPRILRHLERIRDAGRWLHYSREGWHDDRSPLVLEPVRWALEGRPEWIACEQVPDVLPFWQAFAELLERFGYTTAVAKLSAEQYGVPQTRQRAILVASRFGGVATLPEPTHQGYTKRRPFDPESPLPRWVSMAEALGWDDESLVGFPRRADTPSNRAGDDVVTIDGVDYRARDLRRASEPAQHVTSKVRSWSLRATRRPNAAVRSVDEPAPTIIGGHDTANRAWIHDRPATTIACDPRVFQPGGHHTPGAQSQNAIRVSVDEAARLQSFPHGYPWQGSKTKQYEQIGNAIPPLLAAAVLGNLLDLPTWRDVCLSMRPATTDETELTA